MLDAAEKAIPRFHLPIGNIRRQDLNEFLSNVYDLGVSDIKFSSTDYVWAEVNRMWQPVTDRRLDDSEVNTILALLFNESGQTEIGAANAIDSRVDAVISRDKVVSFRLNATGCSVGNTPSGVNITLRAMPQQIPTCAQLGLEPELMDNLFPRYGMVLIVGTTGSGKSTLLAAAHRYRLEERRDDPVHILTYEQPVEYLLKGYAEGFMPEPTQTEVGMGAQLRSMDMVGPNAMRRKGQVIQMGEIRDMDSARAGFELGATGHAAYATMHTETPDRALSRTLQLFPPVEHARVANEFIEQARLVIAQKLARRLDGKVIAFRSWCVFDREVKRSIEDLPTHQWGSEVRKLVAKRGNDFESKAFAALADGLISYESFVEVSSMTRGEANEYCAHRGFNPNAGPVVTSLPTELPVATQNAAPKNEAIVEAEAA
ncbi:MULTISPECIES: ATPase, T2SS/T4P/T4SS family [unclassified Variovorax]|uniref:ATPase, T2SS/T4P/T4SS family n=1 Tax=unclassified Variovorax TaxID=663243 RepID=UPI00076D7EA4|nr:MULTISPECIES: ATPase, T2SS/T4P/T4SS family [unclassified Variovorax]KWT69578.1 pilus retraction ATPase PilT [Variovorax sp. WDL1]PNG48897.1 Twitching mobility protein [Variovorax sp. B2]PNG49404.1 Twitching mobility protein [Variovorax sp. B4]VTV18291.1 Twitching mobility protein [Variovorax sp. WDL1]